MHKKFVLLFSATFVLLILAACGSDEPASQQREPGNPPAPPDPSTLTVEQIVERTRTAMSAVTSFRARGTIVAEDYDPESIANYSYLMEWQYPDRSSVQVEPVEGTDGRFSETRIIEHQYFAKKMDGTWVETRPPSQPKGFGPPVSMYLEELGEKSMQLISYDEIADDGTRVYRLEFSKEQNYFSGDGDDQSEPPIYETQTRVTLLIDQNTFLFVSRIARIQNVSRLNLDETTLVEINPPDAENLKPFVETILTVTEHFYDYNEPVVIELPGEYEPWIESASGSRTTYSSSFPDATPTATPTYSCSYPTATWPGCGIRTAADVEAMLAVFPDADKIAVGDDIVIAFAFEGPPRVDWQADVSIWHVPSASVVQICFTNLAMGGKSNLPGSEIRLFETAFKSKSAEATERLQQVLDDEVLMEQIRSRVSNAELQCVFIG